MSIKTTATLKTFGGKFLKLSHPAKSTNCDMAFNLFIPPQASSSKKVPVLFYLSGLTCTADNCSEKGQLQRKASEKGIAVVYPDTSPRGLEISGEDDEWDMGTGAGFYVDATQSPWSKGYNMYTYVTQELPDVLFKEFAQLDCSRVSITGHSMGGHGALTMFIKNPGKYKSCSAFAPICNPSRSAMGQKQLTAYFGGEDTPGAMEKWKQHDATELVKGWKGGKLDLLLDVGTADPIYKDGNLLPENFVAAAKEAGVGEGVKLRMQEGYDHSYYFISSFADDHVEWAAKALGA